MISTSQTPSLPPTSLTLWLSLNLNCLWSDRVRKFYLSVASSCSNFNIWDFLKLLTEEYCEVQKKDSHLRSHIVISTPHKARNYFNYTQWSIAQLVLFKELLNCFNTQFRNLKSKTQKSKSTTTASNRQYPCYLLIIKCTQPVKQWKDTAKRSRYCATKTRNNYFSHKLRTLIMKSLTILDGSFMSGTMRTIMLLWKLKWGRATSSSHRHFTATSARPLYAFNEMTLLFFNFLCFQSA